MPNYIDNRLAFIDLETLGSDRPTTPVIECAIAVTDFNLKLLHKKSWIFPGALDNVTLDQIDPAVIRMHAVNGLWKALIDARRNPFNTALDTWTNIENWLRHATGLRYEAGRILVAGSGFDHFDRPIIEHQGPQLAKILTYYSLDIGSAERILSIIANIDIAPVPTDHRAATCVATQIERMKSYVGVIQRALGVPADQNVLYDPPKETP